jgi:hypothetical protein
MKASGPLASIGLVLGGVIVGVTAVIYHSVFAPFGTAAVVTMILTFAVGLRLVAKTRWPALLGVAVVFTVVVLLAGTDNQGSVLVMGDAAGLSFLGFSTLGATVALAWPKFSARPTSYDREAGIPERTLPQ